MDRSSSRAWALDEFGDVELGDERRRHRALTMATRVAEHPAGRVTEVFEDKAERQGAYDFLEAGRPMSPALLASSQHACLLRAEAHPYLIVPLDGSSLRFTDRRRQKGLGPVGTRVGGAQGLKLLDAMALSPTGVPVGIGTLHFWARSPRRPAPVHRRPPSQRESQHWVDAIDEVSAALGSKRLWFLLDREGDGAAVLTKLGASGHWFTVRSNGTRCLHGRRRAKLRPWLRQRRVRGHLLFEAPVSAERTAHLATLSVKFEPVVVPVRDVGTHAVRPMALTAVHAREIGRGRSSEPPLDWLLLTNLEVHSLGQAKRILDTYAHRWAIEELHRAGKSGLCETERSELRSRSALQTWATFLFAVAIRAERLKHLARERPLAPAEEVFSDAELWAIVALKRRYRKDAFPIPTTMPTLGDVTTWVAELGGYTGKSSGGPPGTITIGRGLEKVVVVAQVLGSLEPGEFPRKMR